MNHCLLICAVLAACVALAAAATRYDLPYVKDVKVDGSASDWADKGFRVGLLTWDGRLAAAKDLTAGFRAGWCDGGLLFCVDVVDDAFVEAPAGDQDLWRRDSVQVIVSGIEGRGRCELLVAPGMDPKHPKPRVVLLRGGRRIEGAAAEAVKVAVRPREGGYRMELLLPWSALGGPMEKGATMKLLLIVNDCDRGRDRFGPRWSAGEGGVRLAEAASDAQDLVIATGAYERLQDPIVRVATVAELVGKPVSIRADRRELATGQVRPDGPRGKAVLRLEPPSTGRLGECDVLVEGKPLAKVSFPSLAALRARTVAGADYDFAAYVFAGKAFPAGKLADGDLLRRALGPHDTKVVFYDARHRPVTEAAAPGRYGAVIELTRPNGRIMRRFRTLCRLPDGVKPDSPVKDITAKLGLGGGVEALLGRYRSRLLRRRPAADLAADPGSAVLMAGLMEASAGGLRLKRLYDVEALDRKWWLARKRQIYGWSKQFAQPLERPRPIARSEPAPTLREGTAAEADVKGDAVKVIDAVCREWAADTDEAFGVCIARRGVVFFHRAYGLRDGRPMKVTDKSNMASASKPMGGLLMMLLVDQGLVDLDDPIDKYLPPFRGLKVKTPVTIRHLYTHTADMTGRSGHNVWDLSERVAAEYEHLKVGGAYEYASRDYTLAGRIVEAVTGETVPELYRKRLIEPLGLANTDGGYMGFGFRSTPLDYAIVGQMLLNRGAYGRQRFFSEKTFRQMLPRSLEPLLGRKTDEAWGIGVRWYDLGGTKQAGIGHEAASKATFRVDLAHDMVIVMARNTAGANFGKHHQRFMDAVYSCLVGEKAR